MPTGTFFEKVEKLKMIHRVLILLGTVVLLAGIFVALVYIPKSKEITRLNKEITGLEKKINQAKIKARTLKKFEAEQVEVEAQFREALTLLPNKREIPSLLRGITQLGSDAELEFRLFSPKKEKARDFYPRNRFNQLSLQHPVDLRPETHLPSQRVSSSPDRHPLYNSLFPDALQRTDSQNLTDLCAANAGRHLLNNRNRYSETTSRKSGRLHGYSKRLALIYKRLHYQAYDSRRQ